MKWVWFGDYGGLISGGTSGIDVRRNSWDAEEISQVMFEHRVSRCHPQSLLIRSGLASLASALQETPDSESSVFLCAIRLQRFSFTWCRWLTCWVDFMLQCSVVTSSSSHIMLQLQHHLTSFLSFKLVNLQSENNSTCWYVTIIMKNMNYNIIIHASSQRSPWS